MPNQVRNIRTVHEEDGMMLEKNVSVPLKNGGVIRCNVFRPKSKAADSVEQFPAIVTLGPYVKDIEYRQ
jgi:predicted acyl esterase